jgi:hypothetical protein
LFKHTDTRRGRNPLIVLLAVIATLGTALALSLGSIAQADTTAGPPDTNTRAVLDPATTAAACNPTPPASASTPCATAANGAQPQSVPPGPTVLSGANGGDFVSIHIDTNGAGGTLSSVTRTTLCRASLTDVSLSAQLLPSNGDCIPGGAAGMTGAEPGNGNHSAGGSSPPSTYLDYTYSIGEGTYTPVSGTPITCNASNPCNLWIQESVTNSGDGSGNVFKHYLVTYTGQPGAPTVNVTPGISKLTVDVTPPTNDGNTANPPGLTYHLTVTGGDCPTPAGCAAQSGTGTHYVLQPMTPGQTYTVHVTATSTASNGTSTFTGPEGTATGTPVAAPTTAVTQTIYASRPNGALVLTQVCTSHPAGSSGPPASPGFPGQAAGAPTYTGTTTGNGPTSPGQTDQLYNQYPYPTAADGTADPNYPTNCNVDLGIAHLVTSGPNAGQVFQASGNLSEVTVVDTRDTDPGWNAVGNMGTFQNSAQPVGPKATFGGAHLGWVPATPITTPAYHDPGGTTYTQTVSKGATIAPNTADGAGCAGTTPANFACAGGLGSGALLAKGATGSTSGTAITGGLGIARLDAVLNLYIPIYALNGEYSGVLTVSAV